MLSLKEKRILCLEYKCWIDESGNLFYFGTEEEKPYRIGKIYYKPRTGYYHSENILKNKLYEGNEDFEKVLTTFLKSENII
jgi:hypothetical protein